MMGLVISLCLLFSLGSMWCVKVTSRIMKVWCHLVSQHCCLFVSYYGYHTSHPSIHFVVVGDRDDENMYGS